MPNENQSLEPEDGGIGLPAHFYSGLTDGARRYFGCAVKEYADKLLSESKGIEKMEHAGTGEAEITAAHVEEAKWVLVRRLRRSAGLSKWVIAIRIVQTIVAALVGVGASNFSEKWGSVLCIVGVCIGSVLLVVERELTREM